MSAALVTSTELGRLLRPHRPLSRWTIASWTAAGRFGDAVEYRGRIAWYSVPRLIRAGWLQPEPTTAEVSIG